MAPEVVDWNQTADSTSCRNRADKQNGSRAWACFHQQSDCGRRVVRSVALHASQVSLSERRYFNNFGEFETQLAIISVLHGNAVESRSQPLGRWHRRMVVVVRWRKTVVVQSET